MLTVEEMVDRSIWIPHRDQRSVRDLLPWRKRAREGRGGQTDVNTYEKSRTSLPVQPVFKLPMREWFCLFLTWPTSNSSFSYSSSFSFSSSSSSSPSFNSSMCAPQWAQYLRGFYFKERGLWSTACTPIPTELNDWTSSTVDIIVLSLPHTLPPSSSWLLSTRPLSFFHFETHSSLCLPNLPSCFYSLHHLTHFFFNCRCLIVAIMATTSIATDF